MPRALRSLLFFLVVGFVASCRSSDTSEPADIDPRVTLTFEIEDPLTGSGLDLDFEQEVPTGTIALDALRELVDVRLHESMRVEAIAGVEPDPELYYWTLYIDDDYAQVGLHELEVEDDTHVRWIVTELPEWAREGRLPPE